MDWTEELNFPRALANVRRDIAGDWYQDPWNWPEYSYAKTKKWISLVRRANASGICRVYPIDVPKENFGVRPAVVMEPLDRLLYQALVDSQSSNLISDLDPWVFGWRLPRKNPNGTIYSNNSTEWSRYRASIKDFANLNEGGLKTDIVSCFSSIPMIKVIEDINKEGQGGAVRDRLTDMLLAFDRTPRRPGLPQRSKASAALANMYLKRIDPILREHDKKLPQIKRIRVFLGRGGVARWMDDIWLFGPDDATLRAAQVDIQNVARESSLELNMGKTVLLHGEELMAKVLKIQHSAIDNALDADSPDYAPLEELLDTIIDDPENADRTSIHFALTRMRKHNVRSRQQKLIEVAPRMPHGADHLARAFRDFGWWKGMRDWYLEYKDGPWGRMEWSVARLGAMFPTRHRGATAKLRAFFADTLTGNPSLPLLSLAAQRLASWDASTAKEVIRAIVPTVEHPQERRILALALLSARDEPKIIRSILSDFEENALTLRMIQKNKYTPFPLSPDFRADESTSHT